MAKKQTRRTISMNAAMTRVLKTHCDRRGVSVAAWAHEAFADKLRREGAKAIPAYRPPSYARFGINAKVAARSSSLTLRQFIEQLQRELSRSLAKERDK